MTALVLSQIPDAHIATAVATDELALVWVYHNIVDRAGMVVVALNRAGLSVPDLHCPIFRASDHPFRVAMEPDPCDVVDVALKREYRVRVARFDFVEFDSMVTSGSEELLVGGNA